MGFGDFSTRNEGDMLLRNKNTGGLELYDISNNQITGAFFLGTVGLDWEFAGIGPIHAPGSSDLVLRNVNTGAFEVYDIANNQITGAAPLGAGPSRCRHVTAAVADAATARLINVRFGPLCGLKSDISQGPRSARTGLICSKRRW
jgi:hypothetical protein